jgi:hypothetical protein
MMEWQPIETAPDGVDVLVYERYSPTPCIARKTIAGWSANTDFVVVIGDAYLSDNFIDAHVTHWMPLPNPPKEHE